MPNWDEICAKIPSAKTPEEKAARLELWKQMDPNGNGYLSLAEVDKGLRDMGLDDLFDSKPVIIRAFNAAKSLGSKAGVESKGDDYVEKREFRMLLVYLACYMRIYEVFSTADSSGDRRLSKDEFMSVVPKLQQWTTPGKSGEELWAEFNADGGNVVLFTEFADKTIAGVMERDNPEEQ